MQRVFSKFARILGRFKLECGDADKVAIALSGGPDSIALAALTARWHQQSHPTTVSFVASESSDLETFYYSNKLIKPLPTTQEPPIAFVVDHKFRPESTDEAHEAAQRAADIGLRSKVLTVDWGNSIPKRHQKMRAAREARYSLLLQACHDAGSVHLMTAHHADDQAETFLLRLIHASGLDGLSGIAPMNKTFLGSHGVRILRPLLDVHKAELVAVCSGLLVDFAIDPTNEDPSFQRNRLRLLLQEAATAESAACGDANAPLKPLEDLYIAPQIIQDVLSLQKICAQASRDQQRQVTRLLKRAVLHASPKISLTVSKKIAQKVEIQPGYEPFTPHRRRWIHWPSQLTALSRKAHEIPHAILQLGPFNGVDKDVTAAAVSHLLQAVSSSGYPPSLSDCKKLADRIAGGKVVGGFTGGGCAVQPIVHSKGRYMLVVPQRDQVAMVQLIKAPQLPFKSCSAEKKEITSPLPERTSTSSGTSPSAILEERQQHELFMQVAAG